MKPDAASALQSGSVAEVASERLAAARGAEGCVFISEASLGALLRLSAAAAHAPDALLLLHELQVQQVELEMQLDELRRAGNSTTA